MNFSIVIPAYNEGHRLDSVIRRLHETVRNAEPSFEILLVNNGSTDNTAEVARALATDLPELRVVEVMPNQGYGNGILKGLAAANGQVLGWVHADEQAKPEHLVELYQRLLKENCDLAKAVRVERHEHPWRIVQSKIYNLLFQLMFGLNYRDINGTPKIMTRSLFERAKLSSMQWFIDPELMLKVGEMGARVTELEIVWEVRNGGKSKVHLGTMFHFMKHMLRARFFKEK